jgi:hypothetical protein
MERLRNLNHTILAVNQEIVNFIMPRRFEYPKYSSEDLRKEILRIYRVTCSRRTVERIIEMVGFIEELFFCTDRWGTVLEKSLIRYLATREIIVKYSYDRK